MFPNPQDALPLPPHADVDQCRRLAEELAEACRSGGVGPWVDRWLDTLSPELYRQADAVEEFARRQLANCTLAEAQLVLARSHGFADWETLTAHVRELPSAFESAADAIIEGDVVTLQRLLHENPDLIRARSTREHRATLLHYVSANGVEGYRQKSPENAVSVAKILLDAGAEVDATADVYGGGWATLGLVATSSPPRHAGVQDPLIDLLIERGAAIDGAPRGRGLVAECLANGCPEAAELLAKRGAPLSIESAAGIGRIDDVRRFLDDGATREEITHALIAACGYGRKDVVELLLERGADVAANPRRDRQTALHFAVIGGHPEVVKLLLAQNAPLEVVNEYGGTVLGQTLWSAAHGGDPDVYIAIIDMLIAGGAKLPARHVPVNDRIDEVLRRYGSEPEPSWYWFGEKPRGERAS